MTIGLSKDALQKDTSIKLPNTEKWRAIILNKVNTINDKIKTKLVV